jgi:hypothetical protein
VTWEREVAKQEKVKKHAAVPDHGVKLRFKIIGDDLGSAKIHGSISVLMGLILKGLLEEVIIYHDFKVIFAYLFNVNAMRLKVNASSSIVP